MSKKDFSKEIVNDITPEMLDTLSNEAETIANEMGYDSAQDAVENIARNLESTKAGEMRTAARQAGSFASKLALILYEQILENSLGTADVYSWVNNFKTENLKWGNNIQFSKTFTTTAGTYDRTKFIPDATTDPVIETFTVGFLKANGSLTDTAYRYKKSLSLDPKHWLPYFSSGKLSTVISNITAEMMETYRFFVAYKVQQFIKNLADGGNQVSHDNAGENGKSLKLKTITSTAGDTFQAMLDLIKELDDLTKDVNKTTLANDSQNLKPVSLDDLVIFAPKALISKFRSGIMSRLPSATVFDYEKIFNRIIPIGRELKPIIKDSGAPEVVDVVQNDNTFITGDNKIVVIEKSALQHIYVVGENESQYFAENMIQQLTHHMWGFFCFIPWKKGFVFKCDNLLRDPATN